MSLATNQRKALEQLTAGATVKQAASVAGVTDTTIYRWKQDSEFSQALREANERILSDTVTMLTVASVKAVETLIGVLDHPGADFNHKISAAKVILDSTIKLRDLHEFGQRLTEIESRLP